MQIPLVDGEVWWKSAAKIWKWHDFDTKPHEIKAVRDEIWACFEDPKAAKLSSQEAPAGAHQPYDVTTDAIAAALLASQSMMQPRSWA